MSSTQTAASPSCVSRGSVHVFLARDCWRRRVHRCAERDVGSTRRQTGELLWNFQVDTSKRNNERVLTADRKFNDPFFFHSSWREAPIVATDEQIRLGGIYSSPLVVNGVVYLAAQTDFSTRWSKGSISFAARSAPAASAHLSFREVFPLERVKERSERGERHRRLRREGSGERIGRRASQSLELDDATFCNSD